MVVVRVKTDGRTRRLRFDRTFTIGTVTVTVDHPNDDFEEPTDPFIVVDD